MKTDPDSRELGRQPADSSISPETRTPSSVAAVLDELEEKARAATEGPWSAYTYEGVGDVMGPDGKGVAYDREGGCASEEDTTYIAAMHPSTALALIEVAREARLVVDLLADEGDYTPVAQLDGALGRLTEGREP